MESEDKACFCNNCKRHVSAANFATHSAFCERFIFVCMICEEPVQISEKDNHLEDYHSISPCNLCTAAIEKWMLPKHMELCPKRLVTCKYCEADFPLDELSEHVEFCGSRTEKCLLCQKYIMMKEKLKHNELHMLEKQLRAKIIEDEIKQNKVNEVICRTVATEEISEKPSETIGSMSPKISEGKDTCFSEDKPKKMTCKESRNLEIPAHGGAVAPLPEKEFSKRYTQCHICKQTVPWIDFNTHVPNCASSAGKCSLCGDDVASYAMKEHMRKHSDNQSFKDIARHSQNLFECPLCQKQVPETDRDQHITLDCDSLFHVDGTHSLYAAGEDSFECPYCLEKMPQKDKVMHQSFYCTVLIENCGINSDLDSYADITKKTSHSSYKDDQSGETCPTCKNTYPKGKVSEHKNKCHRRKELCALCKQVFDTSCKDVHLKFCPAIDNRNNSDLKTTAQDFRLSNEHKGAIPKNTSIQDMMKPRSAKCTYCHTSYNVDILPNHEMECVHKPVYCKFCDSTISLMDLNTHKCKRRKCKGQNQKMQQQTSKGNGDSFWNKTKKFFTHNDEKEVNDKKVSTQSTYSYESHAYVPTFVKNNEELYFDRTDDTLLPCEFCQKEFPASQLVLHETGCQPDLVSYAKPDLPEKSDSMPDSVKKNSVPVSKFQNIHEAGGISHPFFAINNSVLTRDTSEPIELNGKSRDQTGELPQSCYNRNSSKQLENSRKNEKNGVEKKPLNLHSMWNVGNSSDLRTDHLKEILADSDVDKTVETTNLVEKQNSKELDQQAAEKHLHRDKEMNTMLKFLNNEESGESDEEYVSLSDENGEQENSDMTVNSSMNSKNDIHEKQGDLLLSKKITNKEKPKEIHQEIVGGKAEKNPEEYLKYLADCRIGFRKTIFTSEDNEHCDNQSEKKYGELEENSRFLEGSMNQKEYGRSIKNWSDLKLGRSVAFSADANVNEMIDEEPEKLFKQRATKITESCNDQRNYSKQLTNETAILSFEENAYHPVQAAKNYEPKKLHEQNIPKSSYIANDTKENVEKHFSYIKNCTELENFKGLSEKYNHNNSRGFGNAGDDLEYNRNFRLHLPDFKFSFPETVRKPSEDYLTGRTLPECRSQHNVNQAFVLEPAESQKESKLPLHTVLKTKVKGVGLEEKIAALQRDKKIFSSATNDKNDDVTKWRKWRKKELHDTSDSD